MPLFKCSNPACGCIENTALCNYWEALADNKPVFCSLCDPEIGIWHNEFPRDLPEKFNYKERITFETHKSIYGLPDVFIAPNI